MTGMTRRLTVVLASAVALTSISSALYLVKKPYDLCDIARYPRLFAGRSVAIKGTLYGYSNGLIHLSGTACEENRAWATVELPESIEPDTAAKELLTSIRNLPDRKQYIRAQMIVEGDLEDLGAACFALRFVITAKTLQMLAPAVLVPFPSGQE